MSLFYENRDTDFYCRCRWDGSSCSGSLRVSSHMHYHVELVYLRKGSITAVLDSSLHQFEDDSLFIVFPNQIHSFKSDGREEYQLLIFNPELLPEFAGILNEKTPADPIIRNVSKHPQLLALLDIILQENNNGKRPFRMIALRGLLLALLSKLFRIMSFEKQNGGDSHAIRAIIEFCTKNFGRELSLEILGEELHMSKYYISHLFSSKLKMSFNNYINFLRVSAACRHLSMDVLSITEISELVGFGTIRTFNRAFKKQMGISPSDYRRAHSANNHKDALAK